MITRIAALVILASGPVLTLVDFTPPPPHLALVAPTPQDVKQSIHRDAHLKEIERVERGAQRLFSRFHCAPELQRPLAEGAVDQRVDIRVLVAVAYAESSCGRNCNGPDVGPMQIHVQTWTDFTREQLLDPEVNVAYGAWILGQFIHQFGLREGLHHYNGLGAPATGYADTVLRKAGLAA